MITARGREVEEEGGKVVVLVVVGGAVGSCIFFLLCISQQQLSTLSKVRITVARLNKDLCW